MACMHKNGTEEVFGNVNNVTRVGVEYGDLCNRKIYIRETQKRE